MQCTETSSDEFESDDFLVTNSQTQNPTKSKNEKIQKLKKQNPEKTKKQNSEKTLIQELHRNSTQKGETLPLLSAVNSEQWVRSVVCESDDEFELPIFKCDTNRTKALSAYKFKSNNLCASDQQGMDSQPSTPQKCAESEPIVDSPFQNTRSGLNKSKPIAIVTANDQALVITELFEGQIFKTNNLVEVREALKKYTQTMKYFEVGTKKKSNLADPVEGR